MLILNLLRSGILSFSFCVSFFSYCNIDLTIVGRIDFNGSITRQSLGLLDCLKEELDINVLSLKTVHLNNVNDDLKKIILSPVETFGKVVIFEDSLWFFNKKNFEHIDKESIKIAYSMYESTKIPNQWVKILNEHFDSVVVPDKFLVDIYRDCGVVIPIFMIPLGIYIDEFLELDKPRDFNKKPFVFGNTNRFNSRKNHGLLIDAFVKEFKDNNDVILVLNGGGSTSNSKKNYRKLKKQIEIANAKNIIISDDSLSWQDYINKMSSFDCFINVSSGEGFSITPREALAAGIPCILTNNTAQKTICKTGFVRSIDCKIKKPMYCSNEKQSVGFKFNCSIKSIQNALRDVYENCSFYYNKAQASREWVKQYRWQNLQNKYLNLIKPRKIILGDKNLVTDDYFMTNSIKLFNKYKLILNQD